MYFCTLAFVLSLWLLNTAPAFNLPAAPELAAAGFAFALLALGVNSGKRSDASIEANGAGRRFLMAGAGLLALHVTILVVRALIAGSGDAWALSCAQMPGTMQRIECALQAGIDQNSAFRALSYDLTAALMFWAAFAFSFTRRSWVIPAAVATAGVAFAGISLGAKYLGMTAVLPNFWMTNEFGTERMTYLMQNPTWVWPYLFPALLALTWAFAVVRGPARVAFLAAVLAIFATCLLTQQRGAVLLVFATVATMLVPLASRAFQRVARRAHRGAGVAVGLSVGALAAVGLIVWGYHALGSLIAALGGGTRFATTDLTASSRSSIWQAAGIGIKEHPLLGHGYASWFNSYGPLISRVPGAELLDTAHNYFVQSLFELGTLQLALVLAAVACLTVSSLLRSPQRQRQARLVGLAVVGYLVVASVQEFNFVRSIYYTSALFVGWLLGAGAWQSFASTTPLSASVPQRRGIVVSLWALSSAATIAALVVVFSSSLAGFQYEANSLNGYQPKVRWLRPLGTVTFVQRTHEPSAAERHAIYRIGQARATRYELTPSLHRRTETFVIDGSNENNLAVRARSPLMLPDLIRFDSNVNDFGRSVSAMVYWPPVLSTLPITWQRGMLDWETDPSDPVQKIRWCGPDCAFRMRACPSGAPRSVSLLAARSDVSETAPLQLQVHFATDPAALAASQAPATTVTFKSAMEAQAIEIPADQHVRLVADRPYVAPGDGRILGILVNYSRCP